MNHSTTEIVAAISSVIAWGRASFESLNLISTLRYRRVRPYSSPAGINAQWTREVPEHARSRTSQEEGLPPLNDPNSGGKPLFLTCFLSAALIISRLSARFTLQPHVRDGHAFLQRLAHVVNRQRCDGDRRECLH